MAWATAGSESSRRAQRITRERTGESLAILDLHQPDQATPLGSPVGELGEQSIESLGQLLLFVGDGVGESHRRPRLRRFELDEQAVSRDLLSHDRLCGGRSAAPGQREPEHEKRRSKTSHD